MRPDEVSLSGLGVRQGAGCGAGGRSQLYMNHVLRSDSGLRQEVVRVTVDVGAAAEEARRAAGLSQRVLAERAGLSQPTLNRILTGKRPAKMTEVLKIADATGCTVAELTGTAVTGRLQWVARATNDSSMNAMRQRLAHFFELDAYLDDQAIPPSR